MSSAKYPGKAISKSHVRRFDSQNVSLCAVLTSDEKLSWWDSGTKCFIRNTVLTLGTSSFTLKTASCRWFNKRLETFLWDCTPRQHDCIRSSLLICCQLHNLLCYHIQKVLYWTQLWSPGRSLKFTDLTIMFMLPVQRDAGWLREAKIWPDNFCLSSNQHVFPAQCWWVCASSK